MHVSQRFVFRLARSAVAILGAVLIVGGGGGGVAAWGRPVPQPSAASAPRDTTDAQATADSTWRWAGTWEAQLRQRALYRQSGPSRAPATDTAAADASNGVSIGGLVINDTRTTLGRDFYDVFYSRWETPKGAENVMIRVREQPRPNLGTRILVEVEDQTVFRANLRPRLEQIKRAARVALARAHRYIKQRYEPRGRY